MRGLTPDRPADQDSTGHHREPHRPELFRYISHDWPWIAAVLIVAFAAAWPAISQPGLLNTRGGGDSPFLLQRLHQMTAALADGHFPVRWMPDANYGYGYPFYHYYAPLSIYIAAAFHFAGFDFVRAIHLAQLAGFAVAGLGMFYLGRRWFGSQWAGLLAATAYTVAPFHMVNVYVRGDSLAEFWAMAFYPLILLAADGLLEVITARRRQTTSDRPQTTDQRQRWSLARHPAGIARPLALFALAYAALILSHNISALIFSPFLVLYLSIRLLTGERERATDDDRPPVGDDRGILVGGLWSILGIFLAFALAAWFFIPALAEQDMAQLGPVTEGYFHFSNHFRGLDLVQGGLLFDYNPDGGVAFRLGLIQLSLAIVGAAAWLFSQRTTNHKKAALSEERWRASFVIFAALFAVLMITPLSRPLWDNLPLLPFAQFPWRFLSIASFFLALLAGGLVRVTERPAARAGIALLGSLVLLTAGLLGLRTDHLILTDADVTAERLAEYEWFTGNIGTTVSAEYLTPQASPRPWTSHWLNASERDEVIATTGEVSAGLVERKTTEQTWRLAVGEGGAVAVFPTLYWPGWQATIDGHPADLGAFPASGLIALSVTEGEHEVVLELGRTPVRVVAEIVSLAAVATAVILLFVGGPRPITADLSQLSDGRSPELGQRSNPAHALASSPARFVHGLLAVGCGLLLLALFALLWRNDPVELPRGDLTWDFAQMGYLHHSPGGVGFSSGARLYEYGYSAEQITAGEPLTITLSLAPGEGHTATLALVTPASAWPTPDGTADPPTLASQTIALDGETAVFVLPISDQAPKGLYIPRFTVDGARPVTPSGTVRGDLFLRPVGVTAGEPSSEQSSSALIDVRPTAMNIVDDSTLDGQFTWLISQPFGSRYQVSWRLQNGDGHVLSQLDTQPGYGFQPTDGWATNAPVNDWLALRLPDDLSGPTPYSLAMILYDATTGEPLLLRRVGEIVDSGGRLAYQPVQPIFTAPEGIKTANVVFAEDGSPLIGLIGYEMGGYDPAQTAGVLELTLYWQALAGIPTDFARFVHLIDASGAAITQVDGHPAGNSYPTGQWASGEVVADTVRLDLSAVRPGDYRVAVGFYRPVEGLPRLDAADAADLLPDGRAILSENVIVPTP